jgi:hypothetical protein
MLAAAAALLTASAAAAEPVYFHKPDVDRAAFEADLSECVELAGGVRVKPMTVYSPNIYAAAAGAFFAGFMKSREERQMTKNVLRTCMTDKGYRRVEASEAVSRELGRLDDEARAERLFTLASAPQPDGKVLPQ